MKTTSPEFRAHLDREVTALCTCWRIERTDGKVLYFTDSDQDVTVGGDLVVPGDVYKSIGAYSRSAIETTSSLSVDNLEISGLANHLSLPVEELNAGAYDHAEVKIFMTSWIDPSVGEIKLRRGFFGEVQVLPNDTFTVELRGLLQRLSHTYTDVYSTTCRHDLGDGVNKAIGCGVDLSHPFSTEGVHVPVPFADPGFEEVGKVGLIGSAVWYNPLNDEELVDDNDSFSGTYSARGATGGGNITQDTSLFEMGTEFLSHIDNNQVTFTGYGYRKDDGDMGRLRFRFLSDDLRTLNIGSYAAINSSNYVSVGVVDVTGDFTFETWFRQHSRWLATSPTISLLRSGSGSPGFGRAVAYNNGRFLYVDRAGKSGGFLAVDHPLSFGEWTHVAVTQTGTTQRMYINGVLRGEATDVDFTGITTSIIGEGIDSEYDIDEYRVWDYARTREEILETMRKDVSGDASLVLYYPFDGDTLDYGSESLGAMSFPGSFGTGYSPVGVSLRGTQSRYNSTFEDVGTEWTLVSGEDIAVPARTRYVKTIFDHTSAAGTASGSRLDSVFGWFEDADNNVVMPNFSVGENAAVWTRAGMITSSDDNRVFRAIIDEPRAQDAWFQGGLVTFFSGRNSGGSMEVKKWTQETGEVELFLSMPYPLEPGDLFTIYPGCDKTRLSCSALFNNIWDFYGFPDIPGEDELFRYPDSK